MNHVSKRLELTSTPLSPPRQFPISSTVVSGVAVGTDSCAILITGAVLYGALINFSTDTFGIYAAAICFVWITVLMLFQFSGLYQFEAVLRPLSSVDKLVISFLTSFLFLLAAAFSVKVSSTISRVWIGGFGTGAFAATFLIRLALSRLVLQLSRQGVFTRHVIIAGSSEHVARLLRRMQDVRPDFVSLTGLFVDGAARSNLCGVPVMGGLGDIATFVRHSRVDDVVIALPWSAERRVLALVDQLRELPVNVYLGSDLVGFSLDFREPPGHFANAPVFAVIGHPLSGWGVAIKAIEDYALGTLALILALP